jgi:hypothetical protein
VSRLTELFGADAGYMGYGIRSPLFVAGTHCRNPRGETINPKTTSFYHRSTWFDPHPITLKAMKAMVGRRSAGADDVPDDDKLFTEDVVVIVPKLTKKQKVQATFSISQQLQYARIPACEVFKDHRNRWLFSCTSVNFCRKIAEQYRASNDYDGFISDAWDYASQLNQQLVEPLSAKEVKKTVKSVVNWCTSEKYHPVEYSSETARAAAHMSWLIRRGPNHITVEQKAKSHNMSVSTYYRKSLHLRKPILFATRNKLNGAAQLASLATRVVNKDKDSTIRVKNSLLPRHVVVAARSYVDIPGRGSESIISGYNDVEIGKRVNATGPPSS